MSDSTQVPRYSLWQAVSTAISVSMRAIEEVRALSRQPGPQGERGPAGHMKTAKAYQGGVHYDGDVVAHKGATYQALRDTGQEPPHADWLCLAERGKDADGFAVRSTYDADTEYKRFDIVAMNGGSFVALKDAPGACPGAGWQLWTSPGKRGEKGLPGERGERGLRGEQGSPGPVIVGWREDVKTYTAVPVMSDGTDGPALNVRGMFEQFFAETR